MAIRVMENGVKFCISGQFIHWYLANTGQEWIQNYQP